MRRMGARLLSIVGLAVAVAVAVALGLCLAGPAGASSPPAQPSTVPARQADQCDSATGTWTLHWIITNADSANIKASFTLLGTTTKATPAVIGYPGNPSNYPTTGHLYVTGVPSGTNVQGTMSVSWVDGSALRIGPVGINPGTCNKAVATTTTTAPVAPPPTSPGQTTTTAPGRPGVTTTLAPGDPNATTTSVLAQTNGSDVTVDPGALAGGDTSTTLGSTDDTATEAGALAASPASSNGSGGSSSGTVWIVLGIFAVAVIGGTTMLVMSRRSSAATDQGTPPES
jgi:hypothetical protein